MSLLSRSRLPLTFFTPRALGHLPITVRCSSLASCLRHVGNTGDSCRAFSSAPSCTHRQPMSIPTQQKALAILPSTGKWSLVTVPVDTPGPGELLIRVEAAGLNPLDWKIQASAGGYGNSARSYNRITGIDAAGVVAAIGEGVTRVAVGDRVLLEGTFNNRMATFKQYTITRANIVAKVPDNISLDQAASIPLGLMTAVVGLYNKKWERGGAELVAPWKEGGRGKYAGQPIVIFGGSSSVGQFAIQCAKLSGFSPIITTVSPRNNELVKSLGATHALDRRLPPVEIVSAVKNITSTPVRIVYDAISLPSTQFPAYDILASGGKLILVLGSQIPEDAETPDKETFTTYGSVHEEDNWETTQEMFAHLTQYLESGDLKPSPVEVLPNGLLGIIEGLERMKRDEVSGRKLIARPHETLPSK